MKAINAPRLMLSFKLVQLCVGMALLSHVNACLWYLVGKNADDGWPSRVSNTDGAYMYLTSLHWVLTQFQGTSEVTPGRVVGERAYAVATVMCSSLVLSAFISNFTNIVMQIQALSVEKDKQTQNLCTYLNSHRISRPLAMRVRTYLLWQQEMDRDKSREALQILPPQLVMELEFEIYVPTMSVHPFFAEFCVVFPRLSRHLFHESLHPLYFAPGDVVFSAQESGFSMYFAVSGLLDYAVLLRHQGEQTMSSREVIGANDFLSEPP